MKIGKLQKGLVGHWSLDEQSYNPATKRFTDLSAYCNHGTSANAAVFGADRMGQANRAMVFNGTNDYIDCGNDASLNITNAITLTSWFKPKIIGNVGIITKRASAVSNSAYSLLVDDVFRANIHITHNGGTTAKVMGDVLTDVNIWYNITGTFDGEYLKLYQDNVLVDTLYTPGIIFTSTTNAVIGAVNSPVAGFLNGSILESRIYNRALTAEEITLLYESYRPKVMI